MIKRILYFTAIVVVLYLIIFNIHSYTLLKNEIYTSFSLHSVYLFHFIGAILVYAVVEFVADKLPTQAGYAYLASIFLKIGFFVLIFKDTIFTNDNLTKPERISLVIPLILFLIAEAIGVSKLLNSK